MTDAVFAGLRQLRGVDIGQTIQQSGIDPLEALRQPIARLVEGGLIAHHGERLRATEAGILVLDQVIATLFADLD
jgi:coproporphyrinogen III oxidase-like Fe-S oxidoreductase